MDYFKDYVPPPDLKKIIFFKKFLKIKKQFNLTINAHTIPRFAINISFFIKEFTFDWVRLVIATKC